MTLIMRLSVDGAVLEAQAISGPDHWFSLRLPAREIRIVSGSARPVDLGVNGDIRRLGVQVFGIRFEKGGQHAELPLEAGEFVDGFHELERGGFRFTNGAAVLPEVLLPDWHGDVSLCIRAEPWRGSRQSTPPDQTRQMVERFESLGWDCEFAFVQRHHQATTRIGLLSWSRTMPDRLPAALDAGFAGVGDPARSRLAWSGGEYFIETPWFRTHTQYFAQGDAAEERQILERGCARLRLLRRKLLADLATPSRIFLHAAPAALLGPDRMRDIHAALRRHGPARLLCVTDGASPAVDRLAEGIYAARLSRFVAAAGPYDEWIAICRQACDLDDARR